MPEHDRTDGPPSRGPATAPKVGEVARELFGLDQLREGQAEAMSAVLGGRDVLAVMPSGHGKSAIYQVPATMRPGTALVVSPLIALQADQVESIAQQLGEHRAFAVNSSLPAARLRSAWAALEDGSAAFLFLAPEQLSREETLARLEAAEISLIAVDEAHCVSAWGHDFRPDYLALAASIARLGHPPVVALTATASPDTRSDIVDRLGLRDPCVVLQSFDRPNLHLAVTRHEDAAAQREAVIDQVCSLSGPGLVYAGTRRETETLAAAIAERGLATAAYHAGRRARDRATIHEQFLDGELDVVVATNAFGMGIDKPDVRFIVHAQVPGSLDAYYQEIGRAGRDGDPARIHLHYRPEDLGMQRYFTASAPDPADLRRVFAAVRDHAPIRPGALREHTGLTVRAQKRMINLLEQSGSVTVRRDGLRPAGGRTPADAVQEATAETDAREAIDSSRIERMRHYSEASTCRRRELLTYFGEEAGAYCGACDVCETSDRADLEHASAGPSDGFPPRTPVLHREFGPGTVMSGEPDRLTILFEEVGYRDIAVSAMRGDASLLVRDDGQR